MSSEDNVYIVQGSNGGPIKIGMSANLSGRIGMLQEGNPYELVVLAVSYGGGYDFETELHRKYRPWRIRGEWFSEEILPNAVEDVVNYRWYERIIETVYGRSIEESQKQRRQAIDELMKGVNHVS